MASRMRVSHEAILPRTAGAEAGTGADARPEAVPVVAPEGLRPT